MKMNGKKWAAAAAVLAVLAFAFWYGGDAPGLRGWSAGEEGSSVGVSASVSTDGSRSEQGEPPESSAPDASAQEAEKPEPQPDASVGGEGEKEPPASSAMDIDPKTGQDQYHTDPVPQGKPAPAEPQQTEPAPEVSRCTISISCAAILNHMDWLDPDKAELVPADGWLLPATQAEFHEGESVFDVLRRVCRDKGLHMEFSNTPMYNSAYIEGIGNLYEFDCGEQSGWMYAVNGWYPNYGCSRYALKDGDTVTWAYTCDYGRDIGGDYFGQSGDET